MLDLITGITGSAMSIGVSGITSPIPAWARCRELSSMIATLILVMCINKSRIRTAFLVGITRMEIMKDSEGQNTPLTVPSTRAAPTS